MNSIKEQGSAYITNLFKPRSTHYNLRNSGLNVEQPAYSGLFYHNSFTYKIAHTVKPVLSGHPWGIAKCLLNTGPLKMNFGCGQIHILFNYITGNNNK